MISAAGKGVLRSFHGDESNYIDAIPADMVSNATIVAMWNYLENGDRRRYINLTSSSELVVPWSSILDIGKKITSTTVPFNNSLWIPGGSMTRFKWLHNIRAFFYHWLPAVLIDILLTCFGYKPFLIKVYNRINKGIEVLDYYSKNVWTFPADTILEISDSLNAREKMLYRMDNASKSSGDPLPFISPLSPFITNKQHLSSPLPHSFFIRYPIPTQEAGHTLHTGHTGHSLTAVDPWLATIGIRISTFSMIFTWLLRLIDLLFVLITTLVWVMRLKCIRFGLTVLFWYVVANFLGVRLALVVFMLEAFYDNYFIH
ncbi:Fatty acyl-CoA reductase wat [Eumeta japonica]|uniref:Fatty acyl-CoA reductase wat n=1 Tax=Eumeta variegata TaxID=151549 RepID=A0A4C1WEW3_EUMVA|nr:Fatty acyl-CoA reductase wat [Eumeta japonica]